MSTATREEHLTPAATPPEADTPITTYTPDPQDRGHLVFVILPQEKQDEHQYILHGMFHKDEKRAEYLRTCLSHPEQYVVRPLYLQWATSKTITPTSLEELDPQILTLLDDTIPHERSYHFLWGQLCKLCSERGSPRFLKKPTRPVPAGAPPWYQAFRSAVTKEPTVVVSPETARRHLETSLREHSLLHG